MVIILKVTVNGVDCQLTISYDNEKKTKANVAILALRELRLLPNNPL